MPGIDKYYSIKEAMEILRRSRPTVLAYIRAGLLKAHKLNPDAKNSKIIIAETDLKEFIQNSIDDNGKAPRGYYQELYPRPHKRDSAIKAE